MQKDIKNFLRMGYYLDYENNLFISPKKYLIQVNKQEMLEQANSILENIFSNIISENNLTEIVVPLSGGFDSRLILSYLLKYKKAKDIKTYTFGTPGTYDYEIGNILARTVGTSHYAIDMSSIEMGVDDVIYNNKKLNSQCMLFYSTPFHVLDSFFGKDTHYFSGFMGDPVAGTKLKDITLIEEAKTKFISDNSITNFIFDFEDGFLDISEESLSIYENIDFNNRQSKYIRPHVAPTNNYICPFIEEDFINFMFSLPTKYRKDCNFYRELCIHSNKSLFALPLKDYHGLSIGSSKNHIFSKKLLNHSLYTLSKLINFNYVDKRTNYFNIRKKLQTDKLFTQAFNELYHIGAKKISSLGLLSYSESMQYLKHSKNDNDLVVIASIGTQVISGKEW